MKYFILFFISFIQLISAAQPDINNICKLEENRLIFLLDVKWTSKEKQEVSNIFDLDNLLLEKAFLEIPLITFDSVVWQVKRKNNRIIELSKELNITSSGDIETYNIVNFDLFNLNIKNLIPYNFVSYGANDFKLETAFNYSDSIARFYLPEYNKARKVYLSGTFNGWSTMLTAMQYQDSGWMVELKLPPNRYLYKYIVDGKWTPDPNNLLQEKNEHNTKNSVLYCYNHVFKLKAYKDARKVILSGSFNNWKKNKLKMKKTESGWELPVFIKEGTHSYKFIVDNKWITDPANPLIRDDGTGNKNSILEIGEKHEFYLKDFSDAEKIILTGSFNNWNTRELNMEKTTNGWRLPYVLAQGVYEYKYITDGTWMIDSANLHTTGLGKYMNSVLVVKPNYTFSLNHYQDIEKVSITGSFNGWNTAGYSMKKENGKWIFPIYLPRGKHLYKFIVDDKWIIDPENDLWEKNQYGSENSVLWIK